jgi:hypothetical protein
MLVLFSIIENPQIQIFSAFGPRDHELAQFYCQALTRSFEKKAAKIVNVKLNFF